MNDLVGEIFGRLTVISRSDRRRASNGGLRFVCRCMCGKKITVDRNNLVRKDKGIQSCGCLH